MDAATDRHWGIVLAGGEGRRLKSFIRPILGGRGEAEALQELYRRLHSVNFSRAILARGVECLSVLRVKGVYWSDWGNPEQVRKDVARFAPASLHETRLRSSPP